MQREKRWKDGRMESEKGQPAIISIQRGASGRESEQVHSLSSFYPLLIHLSPPLFSSPLPFPLLSSPLPFLSSPLPFLSSSLLSFPLLFSSLISSLFLSSPFLSFSCISSSFLAPPPPRLPPPPPLPPPLSPSIPSSRRRGSSWCRRSPRRTRW